MASLAVRQALDALVAAAWTHTPIVSLNVDGAPPAQGSAFLEVSYPVADEEQMTTGAPGSNYFRETGAMRVALFAPVGLGLAPWLEWIDALRAALRAKTFANGFGETIEAAPAVQHGESDDGAYYELSFAVVYRYDIRG